MAPLRKKMRIQAVPAQSKCSELNLPSLHKHIHESFPHSFAKLPPIGEMTFVEQTANINGSGKKIFVGYIKKEDSLSEMPLWAYVMDSCHVEFVCGGIEKIAIRKRHQVSLIQPFSHVNTGLEKQWFPKLESLIAYYLVAGGHWNTFTDGPRKAVSLEGLKRACEAVAEAISKNENETQQKADSETELEEFDPDPDSLFVPESWPQRKKNKSGSGSAMPGKTFSFLLQDPVLTDRLGSEEDTSPRLTAKQIEKICVNHEILKNEVQCLEQKVVNQSEEAANLKRRLDILLNWMDSDKCLSKVEKKRRRDVLETFRLV